jgi:hypothetical protein
MPFSEYWKKHGLHSSRVLVLVLSLSESAEPEDYPARFVEVLRVAESGSQLPARSRPVTNAASESQSFGCILTELSSVSDRGLRLTRRVLFLLKS